MIGIYGANGFIGTALTRYLLKCGHKVRAVSRSFSDAFKTEFADHLELVLLDVTDSDAVLQSLDGVDTAIHLVSSVSPGHGNTHMQEDIQTNLAANVAFMESCIARKTGRVIFLSSGGTVYGRPEQTPIPEDHPCNPISSYGLIKYCSEKYIQMFGEVSGLDYVIVRLANPYGPGQVFKNSQGLVPAILGRHADGQPVTILGNGSAERDYIYIDDAVSALEKMIGNPQISQTILNIGSGEGRSVLEVVGAIEAALGVQLEKEFLSRRETDVQKSVLDISKAVSLLEWAPQIEFEEGIRRTVAG